LPDVGEGYSSDEEINGFQYAPITRIESLKFRASNYVQKNEANIFDVYIFHEELGVGAYGRVVKAKHIPTS
jgi:calcium-dependent protein kinase